MNIPVIKTQFKNIPFFEKTSNTLFIITYFFSPAKKILVKNNNRENKCEMVFINKLPVHHSKSEICENSKLHE